LGSHPERQAAVPATDSDLGTGNFSTSSHGAMAKGWLISLGSIPDVPSGKVTVCELENHHL
jgi:hypothetical protein